MSNFTTADIAAMRKRIADKLDVEPLADYKAAYGTKAKGKTEPRDRGMNKTEARYAAHLEREKSAGRILFYDYECMKVRLADTCGYTSDFMIMDADGHIIFADTKAYWQKQGKPGITDDALVKMKVVGERYWMFTFKAVWEVDGVWHERTF